MAGLVLKNIYKTYKNDVTAVKDFSMEIKDGEFIVFVGPSGCGKSTVLRMIAGLEEITSGELYINGNYMNDVEPKYRNIAMVFQNYALYPFLDVYDNIAFGLKLRHVPKEEIKKKVEEVSKVLGLEEYLKRKPGALSGGQRQRVALGRAIVKDADIFLFDEPLSNLDAKLRTEMRSEIIRLYEKLKTTFIYVTHDQVEAMTMGTRIVVLKNGEIQQFDTPTNLYDHPANKFVASFIGTPQMNFFKAKITKEDGEYFAEIINGNKISLGNLDLIDEYKDKDLFEATLGIRSENVYEDQDGIPVYLNVIESLGSECLLFLNFENDFDSISSKKETEFVMKKPGRTEHHFGDQIKVSLDTENLCLFDIDTENSLLKY